MSSQVVYEDRWGDVLDRPDANYVEIRWFDTTREISKQQFADWLSMLAGIVEEKRRSGILTDAVRFLMARDYMDEGWRNDNIVPRYNDVGLEKFAFLMPEGMPLIGSDPAKEGPAKYPTAHFAARADAVAWLAE